MSEIAPINNINIFQYFTKAKDKNHNGKIEKAEGYESYKSVDSNKDEIITSEEAWKYLEEGGFKPDINYPDLMHILGMQSIKKNISIQKGFAILNIAKNKKEMNYYSSDGSFSFAVSSAVHALLHTKNEDAIKKLTAYFINKENPCWLRLSIVSRLRNIYSLHAGATPKDKLPNFVNVEIKKIINDKTDDQEMRMGLISGYYIGENLGKNGIIELKKIIEDQFDVPKVRGGALDALIYYELSNEKIQLSSRIKTSFEYLMALLNREKNTDMISKIFGQFEKFAAKINELHDHHLDVEREKTIQNLDSKYLYVLISAAGNELYTSTFLICFDELAKRVKQSGLNYASFIKKFDPNCKLLPRFFLTLGKFGKLDSALESSPPLFEALKQLLNNKENLIMLSYGIDKSLKSKNQDLVSKMSSMIYSAFNNAQDKELKCILSVIIKRNQKAFKIGRDDWNNYISNVKTELNIPYDKYFEKGVLKTLMVFHLPEDLFDMRSYFAARGFVELKQEKALVGKVIVLSKKYNGKSVQIFCVDAKNIDVIPKLQKENDFAIFAHRGHSYHREETYKAIKLPKDYPVIIFDGSCGSYSNIGNLSEQFKDNYFFFMGHLQIGTTDVNQQTLNLMFDLLHKGEVKTIPQLGNILAQNTPGNDVTHMVFPGQGLTDLITYNLWLLRQRQK